MQHVRFPQLEPKDNKQACACTCTARAGAQGQRKHGLLSWPNDNMQASACALYMQELKGNIRVFCRVRPIAGAGGQADSPPLSVEFPETNDILSAGITLQVRTLSSTKCDEGAHHACSDSLALRTLPVCGLTPSTSTLRGACHVTSLARRWRSPLSLAHWAPSAAGQAAPPRRTLLCSSLCAAALADAAPLL